MKFTQENDDIPVLGTNTILAGEYFLYLFVIIKFLLS